MAKTSLTYGIMPTEATFDEAFDREVPSGYFDFGNDPRVGNDSLSRSQLWRELKKAVREFEAGDDEAGVWVADVLYSLGFEWI